MKQQVIEKIDNKQNETVMDAKNLPEGVTDNLPPNVTEEPQDAEHMDLRYIRNSPALVDVYLAVSDDEGQMLGDTEVETQVKTFIDQYKDLKVDEIENVDSVIEELKQLYSRYSILVNKSEGICNGMVTKYRIRQGMLLNIEKKLLRKDNKQWVEHFNQTYGPKYLRSAQDYMALARTPNIIRYAVYGKERLVEIRRAIKTLEIKSDDPIASFLEQYSIPYNPQDPQTDETLLGLKVEIDHAIAMTKIKKVERKNNLEFSLDTELLKRLIGLSNKVDNGLISDLLIIKKAGGDVNQHLEDVYISGGNGHHLLEPIKKVTGFPRLVADFKSTVDYIREHSDLADRIESSQIDELERYISDLKEFVES
jgi:hypothetical protein